MSPFLNGLLFGLIFIFALGPAFFALIQTSIQQGFRKAIFFAIGVSLSDVFYVMITLFGMSQVMETDNFKFWMAIFGSGMLLGYSIYSWFKTPVIEEVELTNDVNYAKYVFKGFLLNGLNPLIIVSWATWISTIAVNFDYGFSKQLQFFVGMLLSILSMDVGKAFVSHKLKHMVTVRFVRAMNRIVAVMMLTFAIRILYYIFENYT
ncbi:MAG: LysE family transporter [Cyclobacteriaceae bacterium]